MRQFCLTFSISLLTLSSVAIAPSLAEVAAIPNPLVAPLDAKLMREPKGNVTTANTISQESPTVPSLWWTKENLENSKLLSNWIVYHGETNQQRRVDLAVNQQYWSILDYLEKYDFVNRLGSVTRKDKYNLRVFNVQGELLATYTCNFQLEKPLCNIDMKNQNQFGLGNS
ncbi:hypothetical protein [Calothrix sp. 336/3]|uniref:hypothetical protein n=1 Tax=Calothrix sp. 336/3 TaxID=1337936 RepID=UPI0004E4531D|nr:hypothetical protein [Calothrix sp. 336/3]AKG20153.1 hypothetical protein IJ00_01490 [Calothrix sp. 336/3]